MNCKPRWRAFRLGTFSPKQIFAPRHDRTSISHHRARQALAGKPFEHEHNAHNRTYISRGTPLRSASGEIYAVLVVSYDVTEHKRAEAAAATDLEDTQRLHELSTRLVAEDNISNAVSRDCSNGDRPHPRRCRNHPNSR